MRRECIINSVAACGQGVLPALTSRLKIDQFINITEIENKRVELISSSSSGKVETQGELENKRKRNNRNERGTSTGVNLIVYVR
jgi:hypothetical protein